MRRAALAGQLRIGSEGGDSAARVVRAKSFVALPSCESGVSQALARPAPCADDDRAAFNSARVCSAAARAAEAKSLPDEA